VAVDRANRKTYILRSELYLATSPAWLSPGTLDLTDTFAFPWQTQVRKRKTKAFATNRGLHLKASAFNFCRLVKILGGNWQRQYVPRGATPTRPGRKKETVYEEYDQARP